MGNSGYLRYPHVRGDLVTFVAENDVWLAPLDGGRAWRVSVDRTPVSFPRLSPDASRLAWTSSRDGGREAFVAPVDGGVAERLTFFGHRSTLVRGWLDDDEVIVASSAAAETNARRWLYAVPAAGGAPRRLPYGAAVDLAFHGDAVLLGVHGSTEPAYWKRYRGGTASKLWIDPEGSGAFRRLLPEITASLDSPMFVGGRVAFLSDHEGSGALYSCLPDGADLRRHTDLDGYYARHASSDGTRVVYQRGGELWRLDNLDDAEPRPIEINLGGVREGRQRRPVRTMANLESYSPDRTGRASAIEVRGTVHWLPHRDGPVRTLSATPGVRCRLPRVFPLTGDGARGVVWVDDAEGEEALVVAPLEAPLDAPGAGVAGSGARRLAAGQLGHVRELVAAPDGSSVAVATQDNRVVVVGVADGSVREVARSEQGTASGLVYSPDSAWLAWSNPVLRTGTDLRNIKLARLADLLVGDATPARFEDTEPAFTLDGKHLVFLSNRTFDPVYDTHSFDLGFPVSIRPYLIPLAATTPSPFDPELGGRPVDPSAEESDDDAEKKEDNDDKPTTPATVVDFEGMHERTVPFPVAVGRYHGLVTAKDAVLWLDEPLTGVLGTSRATPESPAPDARLRRYDLVRREESTIAESVDEVEVSGDGTQLVLSTDNGLRVVPSSRKVDDDDSSSISVDLDRVRVVIDPPKEWRQGYDEAWRMMNHKFWRTDMDGVDWSAARERYLPLLDRIGTGDDFNDVLWELIGELGTSHCYALAPGQGGDSARAQGLLGADLRRDEDGSWRVARILPGETSDPAARSPLAAPGVAARVGDAILAVNGRAVDARYGPNALLAGTASKPVELTLGGPDHAGAVPRRVVVVPIANETPLRYHAWVASRRALVRELSGDRLGYLHVPNMLSEGWAEFHRDISDAMAHEGLVLDVRANSGGHTSQLIIERLSRRIAGWEVGRGIQPVSYPADAPRGPVVAVTDEHAGSDGDIVCQAIKELGIGSVVGMRSWGGVIGYDEPYELVDGTTLTQPGFAFWFNTAGWGVENHGVDPDFVVEVTPADYESGEDTQLARAVSVALEALASRPAASPPSLPAPRQ